MAAFLCKYPTVFFSSDINNYFYFTDDVLMTRYHIDNDVFLTDDFFAGCYLDGLLGI